MGELFALSDLVTLSSAEPLSEILRVFARDGAVIISDLISPEVLSKLRNDLDKVVAEHRAGTVSGDPIVEEFWGRNTKRFGRLLTRTASFGDVITHPLMTAISDSILLPHAEDWWLNSAQMMVIGPGEIAQILHRDVNNWPYFHNPQSPDVTLSWMLALGPFTKENGATNLVLGSHLDTEYSRNDNRQVVQAEMPSGSGLLYSGKTIHGGGANNSLDDWRMGMHVSHVVGWLTPEEALPLSFPWELVKGFDKHVQRRLGWRCYNGNSLDAGRLWTIDYEDIPVALHLEE